MNNKTLFSLLIVACLAVLAIFLVRKAAEAPLAYTPGGNQIACTMEAKLCPDGSYVGRSGPRCEFTACPPVVTTSSSTTSTVPVTPAPPVTPTTTSPVIPAGWKTMTDTARRLSFAYPKDTGTTYVTATDWPPTISVTKNTSLTCTVAGVETATAGKTERISIKGTSYCVTRESEGAAGSIYTQYTYAFQRNSDVVTITFTLRSVQCGNYDEPERAACTRQQASFDANALANQIAQTIQLL